MSPGRTRSVARPGWPHDPSRDRSRGDQEAPGAALALLLSWRRGGIMIRRALIGLTLLGCHDLGQGERAVSGLNGGDIEDVGECVKFEGSAVGELGLTLSVAGRTVVFNQWIEKDGEPNEF